MRDASPLRILMTADAVGGVWPYVLTLAEALGARAEVLAAAMGPPPSAIQRAQAAAISGLHVAAGDFPLEWMADASPALDQAVDWLKELARQFRPDILHVNGFAAAVEHWAVPVVVVAHSCVVSWWRAVHKTAPPSEWNGYAKRVVCGLERADRVVAPTGPMLRSLALHYGLPRGGRVIPNGCFIERRITGPKEKFVLAAGRLWDEGKNLRILDEAAALMSWPVFVAGDCRHPTGRSFDARGARALGALAHDILAGWMSRAAVYALPARYEPFGLSVLEAAASGCALILGDIESLRELWDGAAIFVSPDDAGALAQAIDFLMVRDDERKALAAKALRRAQCFSAAAMAERYATLYGELAGRAPGSLARARTGVN